MADFGANVGSGTIANVVAEILKGLSILVVKEIGLARGVKGELRKLKKTLDIILAVMDDAEEKQVKNKAVRMWLEELKDIAYEAEDILDERAYDVLHRRQLITRKRDKVRNYLSIDSNPIKLRLQIAHAMKDINKKLNDHAMRKNTLGLLDRNSGPMDLAQSSKLREVRETDSIVDSSLKIIGRDKDKSNIMKMLLDNEPHNQDGNIQVIPIVGMGGLGKTTLVQLIYDDDKVSQYFELKMWVCVSDDFNVRNLFVKIIESITKNKCKNVSNIDVIVCQLQELLTGKKYLLVLDDVWNKKPGEWVRLRKPLLKGGSGSKILVTTRSEEVAGIMVKGLQSYELGILDEDQSWSLFCERTFGHSGGVVETLNLTRIGKELVKKCGGLPLALIFLVSLLRNKDENEWRVINKNDIWVQSSSETRILPILKLSYDHLPSHLKQCFSYFSIFEKDYTFDRKTMILMWMAEGFLLQPYGGNNLSMEEVGNEYFNSLLGNSFFQDVWKDAFGQVKKFSMHDLVHDLAIYVASDCKCLIWEVYKDLDNIINVRRLNLFVESEGLNFNEIMTTSHNVSKLRTLSVSDTSIKKIESNAFDGVKRLRVLDLHGAKYIEEISLSSMSNLKHLRYLDLSWTKIRNLPESVMSLYHLQTLDVRGCKDLEELPKGIVKLINLRHLYLPDEIISIPREIGELSSLQTLYPFNVGTSSGGRRREVASCGIEILEGLNLLNDCLQINYLKNVTSGTDAQRANLKGKKNLNQMVLNWDDYGFAAREDNNNNDEAVLEALQPHPNLKLLEIDDYLGVRFPRWMGDPSCLQSLTDLDLYRCRKCQQLVGFGKLPSLKKLRLMNMNGIRCLGNEFYGNCGGGSSRSSSNGEAAGVSVVLFPSLKELVLQEMKSLEEWVDYIPPSTTTTVNYSSCFPCLEEIKIDFCYNLRITPTRFPSLKRLTLRNSNERVVLPLITTNLNSLEIVELDDISELRFLPHRLLQGTNLKELEVFGCLYFHGFYQNEEEKEERLTSLKVLKLRRLHNLKFLPDIRSFTSLEDLFIKDCKRFKPIPEDLKCLSSSLKHLKKVHIQNVKEVEDFEWEK